MTYAVAKQLGFAPTDVSWITAPFTNAYAPGEKTFDVDINQVSITEQRRKAVDFSVATATSPRRSSRPRIPPISGASTVAALKTAKLGAQVGITSYTVITDQIQPGEKPGVCARPSVTRWCLTDSTCRSTRARAWC